MTLKVVGYQNNNKKGAQKLVWSFFSKYIFLRNYSYNYTVVSGKETPNVLKLGKESGLDIFDYLPNHESSVILQL